MSRLDLELVSRGLAASRHQAQQLIKTRKVRAAGRVVDKPSHAVDSQTVLEVFDDPGYVGRAGAKLAAALDIFRDISVTGKKCLDAGASTGGFTQVLLQAGAAMVAAVDVGHGQLADSLRQDPRVQVHEGLNVRYLESSDIGFASGLTVVDLSFISLRLVLPALTRATVPGGDMVLLVKPQFELQRSALDSQGVVKSEELRLQALQEVATACVQHGLEIAGEMPSPIQGTYGNVEYLLHARRAVNISTIAPLPTVLERMAALVNYSKERRS